MTNNSIVKTLRDAIASLIGYPPVMGEQLCRFLAPRVLSVSMSTSVARFCSSVRGSGPTEG